MTASQRKRATPPTASRAKPTATALATATTPWARAKSLTVA